MREHTGKQSFYAEISISKHYSNNCFTCGGNDFWWFSFSSWGSWNYSSYNSWNCRASRKDTDMHHLPNRWHNWNCCCKALVGILVIRIVNGVSHLRFDVCLVKLNFPCNMFWCVNKTSMQIKKKNLAWNTLVQYSLEKSFLFLTFS